MRNAAAAVIEPRGILRGIVPIAGRTIEKMMQTGAVERVIVLGDVQEMLERDLVAVDMRLAARPTVRMSKHASEAMWDIKQVQIQ